MNVDRRDRRGDAAAVGGTAVAAGSRSGGRTATQRRRPEPATGAHARDRRVPPVDGTGALSPQTWAVAAEAGRAPEVSGRADRAPAGSAGSAGPRLRVAPPAPVPAPRAPFVVSILVLVVGGVLGILLVNTKINENAFRLDRLQKQQAVLDLRQQQLQKQIADHEAPGNLAAAARGQGLVDSGPPAFIRLPDGKVIGVSQPDGEASADLPGAGG